MGTPALTSRGMKEEEFCKIADFMDRAAQIALKIQETSGKMLKDFVAALEVQYNKRFKIGVQLEVNLVYLYIKQL